MNSKAHGVRWAKDSMDLQWHGLIDDAVVERQHPIEELLQSADPKTLARTKEFIQTILDTFVPTSLKKES